jgi:hypothetical protein
LFGLPQARDEQGNFVVRSTFPPTADIRDSVLVDTVITDPATVIHAGVVVAGHHGRLNMPQGGCALFCAADEMEFRGPHAIAFKWIGNQTSLAEGDRLTCLYLGGDELEMHTNESVVQYEGENYVHPLPGNSLSFEEATRRVSSKDIRLVDERWLEKWSGWLSRV